MFDDIGGKLKPFAKVYTVIGMGIVMIAAIILLFSIGFLGFVYGVIGCISVWATGAMMYGIGQAVENTDALRKKLAPETLLPGSQESETPVYQPTPKRKPWKCASCGMENQGHIAYCNGCGTSRAWSEAQQKEE